MPPFSPPPDVFVEEGKQLFLKSILIPMTYYIDATKSIVNLCKSSNRKQRNLTQKLHFTYMEDTVLSFCPSRHQTHRITEFFGVGLEGASKII